MVAVAQDVVVFDRVNVVPVDDERVLVASLEEVAVLREPAGVMVRGRWLDRNELDAGLAEIAERHR